MKPLSVMFILMCLAGCSSHPPQKLYSGPYVDVPGLGQLAIPDHTQGVGESKSLVIVDWSSDTYWQGRGLRVPVEKMLTSYFSVNSLANTTVQILETAEVRLPREGRCQMQIQTLLREVVHSDLGHVETDVFIPVLTGLAAGEGGTACGVSDDKILELMDAALLQAVIPRCLAKRSKHMWIDGVVIEECYEIVITH
jgi:hypothetical protein